MVNISRRHALLGTLAGGMAGCATTVPGGAFVSVPAPQSALFAHGVASGDPDAQSVVLWTRITTDAATLPVTAEVATDPTFAKPVWTQRTETSAAQDHTVKVIPTGLVPGSTYYYRFIAAGSPSPVGRTKTLPTQADAAKFAVVSCSNYPFGYFNAYDHIARADDLDAVIHLGDYIYEYGDGDYGSKVGNTIGRAHAPSHEITSLDDYRRRHAQYKADPGTQSMHARHGLIAIWDDHETANNAWEKGAENHQPATEGAWADRRRAALQAYYEWMPIRDPEPGKTREALYKSYRWGGLLTLTAIETRLTARTEQLDYDQIVPTLKTQEDIDTFRTQVLGDPRREMMGEAQLNYIETALKTSVAANEPWRVIANQVIFAEVIAPNLAPYASEEMLTALEKEWDQARAFVAFTALGLPLNLDSWDGYPAARERFYDMVKATGTKDLVVLTGDTHESWANDLYTATDEHMGVELGAPGVTSPAPSTYLGDQAADYSLLMRRQNRDVRFHDHKHNGYFTLTLNEDKGRVDFIGISTVLEPAYEAMGLASFDLKRQNGTVELANPRGLGFKERMVY